MMECETGIPACRQKHPGPEASIHEITGRDAGVTLD
jgi:hypothetical protein